MMTDAKYAAWLADLSAPRVVLCELEYASGVEYVASQPFISLPTDTLPNRVYDDLLIEAVDIETRIDGLISFGEISLVDDGQITDWIDRAWQGHEIRLYLGGPEWPRDDFRLHAVGINSGISTARRGEITFEMIDQSAKLDEPLDTGSLPGDAGPVPLALGSIYNAPAFRSSTTTLEYTASFLPVTALTPKDIGNTVPHTDDLAGGTFTLDNATGGELTVDIDEQHNTPTLIAEWVAAQYGLVVGDITMPAYTVGLYYSRETSGRQILDELCQGLGAYWYLDALGALVIQQHVVPTAADVTLFDDDIEYDQIGLSETHPPWASLNLRWGRNYASLRTVAGVIEDNDATEAARLKREWSASEASQSAIDYPRADAVVRDSGISNAIDAATERDRLLALRSVRRDVYSIDAFMPVVEIGQSIAIEHPRLSGRLGRIISVSRSPTRGITSIDVWAGPQPIEPTNILSSDYVVADSVWTSVSDGSTLTYGYGDINGDPNATLVTLIGAAGHHVYHDLAAPLTEGRSYRLTANVRPGNSGFTGSFQIAYYEDGSSVNSTSFTLSTGWQPLILDFLAGAAPTDPSIRLVGYSNGADGDSVVIGKVRLIDMEVA